MYEKKNAEKGLFSGVDEELEKGVKIAEMGGGGYPNRYDQSSSRDIKPGKG